MNFSPPASTRALAVERAFPRVPYVKPVDIDQPPGDSAHLYVAERRGGIWKMLNDDSAPNRGTKYLSLNGRMQFTTPVNSGPNVESQQWGITSFRFHPEFETNGELYVAYNAQPSEDEPVYSYLSRFTAAADGSMDEATEEILLAIALNRPFHHIGQIEFGLDGYLYIGMGDDTFRPLAAGLGAQALDTLKGKILRIDVDAPYPYAVPDDNPFVGTAGARPEIFAYGVRNPWRFAIDRLTGDIWAGDVGGRTVEEISLIEAGNNYGWPVKEGSICLPPNTSCDATGMTDPVFDYTREDGCSVIAGPVYRGPVLPELEGELIFGDACRAEIYTLSYDAANLPYRRKIADMPTPPHGFHTDNDGQVYVWSTSGGSQPLYRLVAVDSDEPAPPGTLPAKLSETGCVDQDDPLGPGDGLVPYAVRSPLWSDGAQKLRAMSVPDAGTIGRSADGDFQYPAGSVLVKSFAFDNIPFETRLFVRHADGSWAGYSYEWEPDGRDATLVSSDGKATVLDNGTAWKYPSRSECLECHTEAAGHTLGLEVVQLNHDMHYPSTGRSANQLSTLAHIGLLSAPLAKAHADLPALADPADESASLHRRVRAYLHANCAGCHRPSGSAQASIDLRHATAMADMGVCGVAPANDLGISGASLLAPGQPETSLLYVRPHRTDADRMPPLGTSIVDGLGTELLYEWASLGLVCAPSADSDADGVANRDDNCLAAGNADQADVDKDGYGDKCDGDFNNDQRTNTLDLSIYAGAHRSCRGDARYDRTLDMNADGCVNSLDLSLYGLTHRAAPGPSALRP